MSDERRYYVTCEDKCLFESMTKEQILSAITQAVESHTISNVDTGFVTTIKEQNGRRAVKLWTGTQAQYNAITPAEDTLYIITDGNPLSDITAAIANLQTQITSHVAKEKKLLFDGTAAIGDSITLADVSNYDVFLIYLNSATTNVPILATKGTDNLNNIHIDGMANGVSPSDYSNVFLRCSLTGTGTSFVVSVAQYSNVADFASAQGNRSVKKIYGLY